MRQLNQNTAAMVLLTAVKTAGFLPMKKGTIIGAVEDIPVTWSDDSYDEKQAGEYTFTAEIDGYAHAQEKPFAVITVGKPSEEKASQKKTHLLRKRYRFKSGSQEK